MTWLEFTLGEGSDAAIKSGGFPAQTFFSKILLRGIPGGGGATLNKYLIDYAHSAGPCCRDVVLLWLLLLVVLLLSLVMSLPLSMSFSLC